MKLLIALFISFFLSFALLIKIDKKIKNVAIFVHIGPILAIGIYLACVFTLNFLEMLFQKSEEEFVLDNSSKYIIYNNNVARKNDRIYYKIDFNKNEITRIINKEYRGKY